jgi:hypothetical protein
MRGENTMNQYADFLNKYLHSTARAGDTILFEPATYFLCDAAPSPAGFITGSLVSWDMHAVMLQIPGSKQGCQ